MPPQLIRRRFDQGYVDSKDDSELAPGELETATGVVYKPGDQRVHKIEGRADHANTGEGSVAVDGLQLCQFDSGGTDTLVALANNTLHQDNGVNGTFESNAALTGSQLSAAHAKNKWYLVTGDANTVLYPDGTRHAMGMQAPAEAMPFTTATAGSVKRPTATSAYSDGGNGAALTNGANVYDTDFNTFAHFEANSAGTQEAKVNGWADDSGLTDRHVIIRWALDGPGAPVYNDPPFADGNPQPNAPVYNPETPWQVRVKFMAALTGNGEDTSTYDQTIYNAVHVGPVATGIAVLDLDDSVVETTLHVLVSFEFISGNTSDPVVLRVKDVQYSNGSDAASFDVLEEAPLLYCYTEYDADEHKESPPSPVTSVDFTSRNVVVLTIPNAAAGTTANADTTDIRIYRSPAGGTNLQMGYIGSIPAATTHTKFYDDFRTYGVDEQPSQIVPQISIGASGTLFFPRDEPPPVLRRITSFKGSLVGLDAVNPRIIRYSAPGFPESWPSIYTLTSLPTPEHDEIMDFVEVGGSLMIGTIAGMTRIDELPRDAAGTFIASEFVQLKGAPGVVGHQAMTEVNYRGASHAAWISHNDGIMVTDGHRYDSISDDLNWSQFDGQDKSGWGLWWIRSLNSLLFAYVDGTAPTQRYFLLSLDKAHVKANGQAKLSGPHYGSIASLTQGLVSNAWKIYSGHRSDGKVYSEQDTAANGLDDSGSYSTTSSPLIIADARSELAPWGGASIMSGRLIKSDFGTGSENAQVTLRVFRDSTTLQATKQSQVSVTDSVPTGAGSIGGQFYVGRYGQYAQAHIQHTGAGVGKILGLDLRVVPGGDEGNIDSQ